MASTKPGSMDDSIATHATLLERLKDCGDQSSWQRFYDTYRALIHDFALKAGLTNSEAEEVVQETVIGVARKLPEFKYDPAKCSFKTWLLNQTVWRVKDQLRKRSPAQQAKASSERDADRTATIERIADPASEHLEAHWEAEWRKSVVAAALQRVKGAANLKDCQMFELHVLRQWTPREVARALEVSVARVYLAKHRVSRLLEKELAQLDKSAI
jgi:RNA polymerase sigma-70 factor (ECF subfamily)